jgi:SAM-dependent methyltransferase
MSYLMVCWLDQLAQKGAFAPGSAMVEIGPQDITTPRDAVLKIAQARRGDPFAAKIVDEIFDGAQARPTCQASFYSIFGIEKYAAIDPFDSRAEYAYDMNFPVPLQGRFDVVTNFGSAEHVFNVCQFFRNIHDMLRPGGLALHVLPAYGDINHGFYNFHPIFFGKLAEANGYDIVDYQYVHNFGNNNAAFMDRGAATGYSYPKVTKDNASEYLEMRRSVYENFVANAGAPETTTYDRIHNNTVFDYSFVALRKTGHGSFVQPSQYGNVHASASQPALGQALRRVKRAGLIARRLFGR